MNKDLVMTTGLGGKHFAKGVILAWLVNTGGSNFKLLETATGLPGKLLVQLLAEMWEEKTVRLDGTVFSQDRRGCPMDRIKKHRSHISAREARQRGWTRRLPRWLRRLIGRKEMRTGYESNV